MMKKNDWWDKLTDDEKIFEVICKMYGYMSDYEDGIEWSMDGAKDLVDDLVRDDLANGCKPLPYDVNDVYDTIHHFFMQDYEELDTEKLYH